MEKGRTYGIIMALCSATLGVYIAATGNAQPAWGIVVASGVGMMALFSNQLSYDITPVKN